MLGSRRLTPLFFLATLSLGTTTALADDAALGREIQSRNANAPTLGSHTLSDVIPALEMLARQPRVPTCVEKTVRHNSSRIATTFGAEGQPCRIYDLSFPTVKGVIDVLKAGSLPLQPFSADDYLAWLRGDTGSIENKMNSFREGFSQQSLDASWYGSLRFKDDQKGLRKSFRLSDLDLGTNLQFAEEERRGIERLLSLAGEAGLFAPEAFKSPEKMLSHISLKWNELDKVFDILVDFDFLPVRGPVALVDYNIQYNYAVEKLVRSAILNSLNYLTGFIPDPTARKVVQVALTDSFEFIDMAYEYQLNRLENTLERNLTDKQATDISRVLVEKGANILAAQRSPLVTQYLLARILQQEFDLNALDKMGKTLRYNAGKSRDGLRAQLNSDLVLKKKCQMSLVEDYFGICTRENGTKRLYSLLSSHKVFVFDLGAPMIHSYAMPSQVLLQRNASWALSAAVRLFPLPILPSSLQGQLVSLVKGFATAGVLDEARLVNSLVESGDNSEFSEYHTQWLFRQNLVPFLAKSPEFEARLVQVGSEALENRVGR